MVYCGKLSGGCYACRKRKTRCDQRPEGCTQCERARRPCPGYRELGLNVRDESENVIRKAKAREAMPPRAKKVRKQEETSPTSLGPQSLSADSGEGDKECTEVVRQFASFRTALPIDDDAGPPASMQLSRPRALSPALEDQAIVFFAANYIIGCPGSTRGDLSYLTELYDINTMEDGLEAGMTAVGFACFSHTVNAPDLMTNARQYYVKALRLTNAALASPEKAKEDATLISIMILGIFELITGSTQRSVEAWAKHVEGSCALLKLRGREQLRKPSGRRMFLQVVTGMMNNCIQCGKALPDFIMQWAWEAKTGLLPTRNPIWIFQEAMMDFTYFQAGISDKICSDPEDIFSQALELDRRLDTVFKPMPREWQYEVVHTSEESDVIYNGTYHVFDNYWMANMWTAIRMTRILLHRIVRTAIMTGNAASPPALNRAEHRQQFDGSMQLLYRMQREILESIPQHFGFAANPGSPSSSRALPVSPMPWYYFRDLNPESFPVLRSGGPHFLLSALWLVGSMDISTPPVRSFVMNALRRIRRDMGVQLAGVLANIIETRSKLRVKSLH